MNYVLLAQFCSFSIIFQVNEKLKRVNWLGILLEREVFLCCEVKGSREERGEREGFCDDLFRVEVWNLGGCFFGVYLRKKNCYFYFCSGRRVWGDFCWLERSSFSKQVVLGTADGSTTRFFPVDMCVELRLGYIL
jgi:hypothetical protein